MRIFLARAFFRTGDIEFNFEKIIKFYNESLRNDCDLLIFSEMSITGFPIYDLVSNKDFIKKSNEFVEKIVDYTKGKKTRILLGCPYFIEGYVKDEIINKSKLYNSVILINDGYIDGISNKTTINKMNLFDEYKYFDTEIVLNNINYDNDNFDILNSDDINENKNILFIKERETDFIISIDTEIEINIENKKNQLKKVAKWTRKNIIYLNNFGYDSRNKYKFFGEIFIVNNFGDIIYENKTISEDIFKFETKIKNGVLDFNYINSNKIGNEDFVNIIAKNYQNKKVIYEVNECIKHKYENNVKIITFDKKLESLGVKFIDISKFINTKRFKKINQELKRVIINNIYGEHIYLSDQLSLL